MGIGLTKRLLTPFSSLLIGTVVIVLGLAAAGAWWAFSRNADQGKYVVLGGAPGAIRAVAFSPDGRTVAAGDDAGTITLWNAETRQEQLHFAGQSGMVYCLAFSPKGET